MKRILAFLILGGVLAAKPVKYAITEATLKTSKYDHWTALEPVYWSVIEQDPGAWKAASKRFTPEQMRLLACYIMVVTPNTLGDQILSDQRPHIWADAMAGLKQANREDLASLLEEAVIIRNSYPENLPDSNLRVAAKIRLIEPSQKWRDALVKQPIEPSLDALVRRIPKQFRFQGTVENPKAE